MKTQKKTLETYTDYGFGFPIQILNAPFVKIRNEWVLNLDFEKYERAVLLNLAHKPACLTGNEIRFIRLTKEMDLKSFGKRFGNVAHSAVIKWEKFGDRPTNMNWATEKDIRLEIVNKLAPRELQTTYQNLEKTAPKRKLCVKLDSKSLNAA